MGKRGPRCGESTHPGDSPGGPGALSCDTCGNDVPTGSSRCPFCGAPLASSPPRRRVVSLKEGQPGAGEADGKLERELASASQAGARLLVLIHGYGSSGEGGVIRDLVRRRLTDRQRRGLLRRWLAGEDYFPSAVPNRADREWLAAQGITGPNPGLTLVFFS